MALNKKKILFITTGAITLVVVVVIVAFLSDIKAFRPQVEAAASNALAMDVHINGRMGIAFFPLFALSLNNVKVRNTGLDVVTIEKMWIGLKIIPLLRKEVQITRVKLFGPVFTIVRYKNGMTNFDRPGRSLSAKRLAVTKLSMSQGTVVYMDETSGDNIEVTSFDLTLRNISYNQMNRAEPAESLSFTGDIRCKTLNIHNITLTNLVMKAVGEKGILDITAVSMNIAGGTGNGSFQVDVTGPAPHYRVIYALNRIRIEELLQQYWLKKTPRKTLEGPINLSVNITAIGKSPDEIKRSLNGALSLIGENLILYHFDIDALITKYERSRNFNLVDVGAYLLAGPFGPILTKSYNYSSLYKESRGGQGIINKLVSIWNVQNGIADARDVALATKHQRLALKGGLNLINERFVDVSVAVLDKKGCAVSREKVHGPFGKPRIEKENIFGSITGPVLNPLRDAWKSIQGDECTVFYSGSVSQPEE
jgi:uncharacterized protein involved in outer membrane biogenesis